MSQSQRFLLGIALMLLILTLIGVGLFSLIGWNYMPRLYYLLPVYFFFAGLLFVTMLKKMGTQKAATSISVTLGVRMLVAFGAIISYIAGLFFDKTHALTFTLSFVVFYIAFSVYETVVLVKMNKSKDTE